MEITTTKQLSEFEKNELMALWNAVYPSNLYYNKLEELDHYFDGLLGIQHYLAKDANFKIIAWAFTFNREDATWFAILIDNAFQKKGMGRALLNALKKDNPKLNGWVIDKAGYYLMNGENYLTPVPFYLKNNFVLCENIRLETDKISALKIEWKTPE